MSESDSGEMKERRLAPPFPSRHELHSAAIPQVPSAGAQGEREIQAPAPPVRREPPRRPRVTLPVPPEPVQDDAEPAEEPVAEKAAPEPAETETESPATESTETRETIFAPVQQHHFQPVRKPEEASEAPQCPLPKRVSASATPSAQASATAAQDMPIRSQINRSAAEERKRRQRRRRLWMTLIALFVLAAIVIGGYWAIKGLRSSGTPILSSDDYPAVDWEADPENHPVVEVVVEPGELGSQIGSSLEAADVVKSSSAFTRAFDANPASSSIKPGTYTLPTKIPAAEALAGLLDETNRSENAITVNPGQTVSQIAEKMVTVGGFSEEEIDSILEDPSLVTALPKQAKGDLEGWLWAGAYEFSPDSSPVELFDQMVTRTVDYLEDQGVPKKQWEETLIRASIVEREVNRVEDMPKVARVIENRISDPDGPTRGMLQMDSTVTYGVGGTAGLPDSAAFADDNPYNTYIVSGLPAGPIATPSAEAIQAVLAPAEGDWLYFVTVNLTTGETIFTESHDELGELTDQLISWCEENPDECKR